MSEQLKKAWYPLTVESNESAYDGSFETSPLSVLSQTPTLEDNNADDDNIIEERTERDGSAGGREGRDSLLENSPDLLQFEEFAGFLPRKGYMDKLIDRYFKSVSPVMCG
ncbi:uncharacterized protein N7483_012371 [Penicillium malachiteum]|uniref:uncharacterized protein n=1 Tax=Penicillium malachiteum TaxID=1324776 RepID=UPI0025473AFE|nr:uncharacterized protein N7483_012371 [Penicillium malachiteum]KAJ5715190.1 hypothetical protein N7483_012371 [Penicillium malachiteum]